MSEYTCLPSVLGSNADYVGYVNACYVIDVTCDLTSQKCQAAPTNSEEN